MSDKPELIQELEALQKKAASELDGNQDCTGKKFRFDISFFTAPNLTDAYWEDDPAAVNIQIFFVDETWEESGGQYRFSDLNLEYSPEWQAVEIPLSDFESLWELPVDPSAVGVIGMELWGGTSSDPISFRLDNFGIVDLGVKRINKDYF